MITKLNKEAYILGLLICSSDNSNSGLIVLILSP